MRNLSGKCALALLGSLAIGISTAFAETVVIDRDPAVVVKPPTVVVTPAPPRPKVAVVPAQRQDCTTVVTKKDGIVRDKTTVARECD
jgi:hypothetical protein